MKSATGKTCIPMRRRSILPVMAGRKRDEYVLQVLEDGRWTDRERLGWPKPLIEASWNLRRLGYEARVMHGTTEVGGAPGAF